MASTLPYSLEFIVKVVGGVLIGVCKKQPFLAAICYFVGHTTHGCLVF